MTAFGQNPDGPGTLLRVSGAGRRIGQAEIVLPAAQIQQGDAGQPAWRAGRRGDYRQRRRVHDRPSRLCTGQLRDAVNRSFAFGHSSEAKNLWEAEEIRRFAQDDELGLLQGVRSAMRTRQPTAIVTIVLVFALGARDASAAERATVAQWAERALLGKTLPNQPPSELDAQGPPFSFVYDGKSSRQFLSSWKTTTTRAAQARPGVSCTSPRTPTKRPVLKSVARRRSSPTFRPSNGCCGSATRARTNADPPADQAARFGRSVADRVRRQRRRGAAPLRGSTCVAADFLPAADSVPVGTEIRLAAIGGRSSDGSMPFFNIQWHGGGLLGAIGWTGQWAMRLARPNSERLLLEAGQETTHFRLHPGESVRTPRILLLSWQGNDPWRGNNLFAGCWWPSTYRGAAAKRSWRRSPGTAGSPSTKATA